MSERDRYTCSSPTAKRNQPSPLEKPSQTKQVSDLESIKERRKFKPHHSNGISQEVTYTIVGEPNDEGWVAVEVETKQGKTRRRISLADYGVIPYASGGWNQANWLEPA